MSESYSEYIQTAREYYNSEDADNFYYHVWGGEDIHIGFYNHPDEDIATASQRSVEHMADRLGDVDKDTRIIDIGAGYGGAARYLAKRFGCHVTALNLSEAENERNRAITEEAGLTPLIDVVDAAFEDIPAPDQSYDIVWCQDSLLHSGERDKVMAEVARIMRPGGRFVFTDIMDSGNCPQEDLQPVLDRIHLSSLGSIEKYRELAKAVGLEGGEFEDHSHQLPQHYGRVRSELLARRDDLQGLVSEAYIERMLKGLEAWVNAGNKGCLSWGILEFRKPAS